jgi:hypothetical protein
VYYSVVLVYVYHTINASIELVRIAEIRASPFVTPIRVPARPLFGPYGGRRHEIGNRGRRLPSRAPKVNKYFNKVIFKTGKT